MIRVGFIINFEKDQWVGGYNHFVNLFNFIKQSKTKNIEPVLITDNPKRIKKENSFKGFEIISTNLVSNTNRYIRLVNKILIIVYSLCGFLSGIGALILAGRTDSGYPNAGLQSELDAIAACIIGGASFFGGRGTVLGVFAGVMIMGILRNGLNLMDVSSFWQQVLIGSIIVLAVYVDVLRRDFGTRK